MLSIEAYEHAEYERQILRLLARGERELRAAKGHLSTRFWRRPIAYSRTREGPGSLHAVRSEAVSRRGRVHPA